MHKGKLTRSIFGTCQLLALYGLVSACGPFGNADSGPGLGLDIGTGSGTGTMPAPTDSSLPSRPMMPIDQSHDCLGNLQWWVDPAF